MFKLEIAADPGVQKAAVAAAAASGVGAWLAHATEVAVGLFGVPLPVVLAAMMAAYGVRSVMHSTGYLQAIVVGGMWTGIGVFGAQLALWLVQVIAMYLLKTEVQIAPAVLPGLAMLLAGAGQYYAPFLAEWGREELERRRNRRHKEDS